MSYYTALLKGVIHCTQRAVKLSPKNMPVRRLYRGKEGMKTEVQYLVRQAPLTDMKARPHSFAAAWARIVFPHPGGPYSSIALGMRIGDSWNRRLNITGSWNISVIAAFAASKPPICSHDIEEDRADEEDDEEKDEEEGGCSLAIETASSTVVYSAELHFN